MLPGRFHDTRVSGVFALTRGWHGFVVDGSNVFSCCLILVPLKDVEHGFTKWDSDAYNSLADWRSWDAMLAVFDMILDGDMEGMGMEHGMDENGMDMGMSNMTMEATKTTSPVDIQKLANSIMFDGP